MSGDDQHAFEEMMSLARQQPDRFCVIEAQVDVATQMEFFDLSATLSEKEDKRSTDTLLGLLYDVDSDEETTKEILVLLAGKSEDVAAFRAIESYLEITTAYLRPWCMLAYQQARLMLEASLLEESKIFISSALGGKANKIRYSVALRLKTRNEFDSFQKDITEKELAYSLSKAESVLESVTFSENTAFVSCLIPIFVYLQPIFDGAIEEINQYGDFLSSKCIITNEKFLTLADLDGLDSALTGK